jgi:hypothetical protein
VRQCFALPLWFFLFGCFGLECGGALLRRFGCCFRVSRLACLGPPLGKKTKGETKAAEQSTAALQTKNQIATVDLVPSGVRNQE